MERERCQIEGCVENSRLEKFVEVVIMMIAAAMDSVIELWTKTFQPEKKLTNQIKYLEGNSIREGNFYCLSLIPQKVLIERRELVKNQLQFLFLKEPCLIIGIINLKTGEQERVFLDEIMSEIFSFSKQNLTSAALKVLSSELSLSHKTLIVSYMAQQTTEEKREHLISFFRETFEKMGDPIGKEL